MWQRQGALCCATTAAIALPQLLRRRSRADASSGRVSAAAMLLRRRRSFASGAEILRQRRRRRLPAAEGCNDICAGRWRVWRCAPGAVLRGPPCGGILQPRQTWYSLIIGEAAWCMCTLLPVYRPPVTAAGKNSKLQPMSQTCETSSDTCVADTGTDRHTTCSMRLSTHPLRLWEVWRAGGASSFQQLEQLGIRVALPLRRPDLWTLQVPRTASDLQRPHLCAQSGPSDS